MARSNNLSFNVSSTGVGRLDYSQDVQKSVEPVTFSWQETYSDYRPFALNVGETATFDIPITPSYKLLLYDFYLSCFPASDILLEVQFFNPFWNIPPVTAPMQTFISKSGTQHIDVVFEKGFPLTDFYRVSGTNQGLAPIDCYYTAHGIKTLQSQLQGA